MLVMHSFNTEVDGLTARYTTSFHIEDLKYEPEWFGMISRTLPDGSEVPDAAIMCDDYYFPMDETSYFAIYDNDWYPLFKGNIVTVAEFRNFYNILHTEWILCHV